MSQVLVDGLAYAESARWHEGRLWLANWGTGEVLAIDLDGEREVVVSVPPRRSRSRSTGCPTARCW